VERGDAAQRAEENPDGPKRKQDRRRLPPELTGLLPKKLEHGLDHVVRRRILRAIHGRETKEVSPIDLSENELADETLSGVSYHLRVLTRMGMVLLKRVEPTRGTLRHFYRSAIEEEPTALSILAQTEELDAPKRKPFRRDGTA
jgi:DNA-binding transcriptional ArsR family regulator